MTKNQLDYMRLQEEKRHNQIVEQETGRANRAQESLTSYRDTSNVRLKESELGIERDKLGETTRHNIMSERIDLGYKDATASENRRHNVAVENETARHNIMTELVGQTSANAALTSAGAAALSSQAAMFNANTRAQELGALIDYRGDLLALNYDQLSELAGYHAGTLGIQQQQVDETNRHNQVTEGQGAIRIGIDRYIAETGRLGLGETQRHNEESESISRESNLIDIYGHTVRGIGSLVNAAARFGGKK